MCCFEHCTLEHPASADDLYTDWLSRRNKTQCCLKSFSTQSSNVKTCRAGDGRHCGATSLNTGAMKHDEASICIFPLTLYVILLREKFLSLSMWIQLKGNRRMFSCCPQKFHLRHKPSALLLCWQWFKPNHCQTQTFWHSMLQDTCIDFYRPPILNTLKGCCSCANLSMLAW